MARTSKAPSKAYQDLRADTQAWKDIQAATRRLQMAKKAGLVANPDIQHLRVTLAPMGYNFTRSKNITQREAKLMIKAAREFLYNQSDPSKGKRKATTMQHMLSEKQKQIDMITKAMGKANVSQDEVYETWKRVYGTGIRNLIKTYGYEAVNSEVIASTADNQNVTYTALQQALSGSGRSALARNNPELQDDYPAWMKDKQISDKDRDFIVNKRNEYTQANNPEAKKAIKDWNATIRNKFKKQTAKPIKITSAGLKDKRSKKGRGI